MTVTPIEIHPGDESARKLWEAVAKLANHLAPQGWCLVGGELIEPPPTDPQLGYRFEINGQTIDVLATDGLRTSPRTLGKQETAQIPGDPSALAGELKGNESKWLKEAEDLLRLDERVGRLDESTVRRARQALGLLAAR